MVQSDMVVDNILTIDTGNPRARKEISTMTMFLIRPIVTDSGT